ncbi:hypothetical protein [Streptomyces cyaneofuscatus]
MGLESEGERRLRGAAARGDVSAVEILVGYLEFHGRRAEAASVLQQSMALGVPGLELALAGVLSEIDDHADESEHWYRAAIEAGIPGAVNDFGVFLSDRGRTLEAESFLQKAASSGDVLAMANLGKHYFDLGDHRSARFWFGKALAKGHTDIVGFLARAELELGDRESSSIHIKQALETGAEFALLAHALYLESSADVDSREIDEAFTRALDDSPEAHFRYANWLRSQDRVDEAIARHEAAISLGELHSHLNLAIIFDELGRPADTERHLRLGMAGGDGESAAALARFLADEGRMDELPGVIREAEHIGHSAQDVEELWKIHNELD